MLLCVCSVGCAQVDNPFLEAPRPPFDPFVERVQPVLQRSCAFLTCHGTPDRALTLYAVGFLREVPTFQGSALPENSLTESELRWNYEALRYRLIDADTADGAALLLKCLPPGEGGIVHGEDIVVFDSREDPGFVALREWVAEGLR